MSYSTRFSNSDSLHQSEATGSNLLQQNSFNSNRESNSFDYVEPKHNYSCQKLINGDRSEAVRVRSMKVNDVFTIPDLRYVTLASNCTNFVKNRGYITAPLSAAEENFPLAFSILMYKDVEQFERLLRAIYRPHNFYCVHIDGKAKYTIKKGVRAVVSCFENVFIASERVKVKWGRFTVLQPELACMRDLLHNQTWRYVCNPL